MRTTLIPLICLGLLAGCSGNERRPEGRTPLRIDDLAIRVAGRTRTYMQSDREGGFLTGVVQGEYDGDRWSVGGTALVNGLRVECSGKILSASLLDSARILPYETVRYYRGGISVGLSGLEGTGDMDVHGFIVRVAQPDRGGVALHVSAGPGSARPGADHSWSWQLAGGGTLLVTGGSACSAMPDGIALEGASGATFLVCTFPGGEDRGISAFLYRRADSLLAARKARMEKLLNASYFRTSDDTVNSAMHWMMLALDGLMVGRRDTFAVSALPWDGSIDVHDNAMSIAGLGLATGDYSRTAAILRSLARYQDTLRGSTSYGRLPDRIVNGRPIYGGADVTPWFVREVYDQVVNADDTTLIRSLYPLIRRSIDGTLKLHADGFNLLVHGPGETWMSDVPRGNRAAEIQVSWYFQQLIGRFVSAYIGDSAAFRRWEDLPEKTARNFSLLFADTVSGTLADHLDAGGKRSDEIRPNGIMCLDLLDDEALRHGVTHEAVKGLFSPLGVRTLAPSDPRFSASGGAPGREYNGPVWTWLAGPFSYALTRYDRQDVSYPIVRRMAGLALTTGMAGALPAMLDASAGAPEASLHGMSEFIRSVYQDYLGVRVDLSSGIFSLQPKLPASLSLAQFTVYAGNSPVEVEYRKNSENTRIYIDAPRLPSAMRVNILWMMESGDAWRGSVGLKAGAPVAIVLGDDDVVVYQGESKGEFRGKRKLKGFSRKAEAGDLTPLP
ncbi:MAG TPA: amylo-alpha-1,6-glucosidase [Bacteroidota bacterium]|nr:amylo-alpha-1,6-glucosidase [Bacteroidota bacterium]